MTNLKRLLLMKLELLAFFYEDSVDWQQIQDFLVAVVELSPYDDDRRWADGLLADDVYRIRGKVNAANDSLERMSTYLQEVGRYSYDRVNQAVAQVLTYSTVSGLLTGSVWAEMAERRMTAVDEALETRFFHRILESAEGPRSRQTFTRYHGPALEAAVTLARLLWDIERRESDIGHPRLTSVSLRAVAMYASKVYHDQP